MLWFWTETFRNKNANYFKICTWRHLKMESLWWFLFCLRSSPCFPYRFNYESVLCLAFLGFRCLSAPICSSFPPNSSYANTCLFGFYHLCNSDCNSSHGNHRKAYIFLVSIFFPFVYQGYSLQTLFHLHTITTTEYCNIVFFCFVLF